MNAVVRIKNQIICRIDNNSPAFFTARDSHLTGIININDSGIDTIADNNRSATWNHLFIEIQHNILIDLQIAFIQRRTGNQFGHYGIHHHKILAGGDAAAVRVDDVIVQLNGTGKIGVRIKKPTAHRFRQ